MVFFHRVMQRQKRDLIAEVDGHSAELRRLEQQLPYLTDDAVRDSVADRVTRMRDYYLVIEQMPTWPVDRPTRRRLSFNNVLLLIPLAGKAIGVTVPGGELLQKLGDIFAAT